MSDDPEGRGATALRIWSGNFLCHRVDAQLSDKVEAGRIDIRVDLGGHTAQARIRSPNGNGAGELPKLSWLKGCPKH